MSCPNSCIAPPLSIFLTRVVHLLQPMNLHDHNHPQSIVYIKNHSWCCKSMALILQFYTEQFLCCIYSSLFHSQPLATNNFFTFPQFYLFQNIIQLQLYSIQFFRICFFHLGVCIGVSSMSFHYLIAHFLLVLNNLLSKYILMCLSNHILKDNLVVSKF